MTFRDLDLKTEYRSRLDDVIKDFYTPVLKQSVLYKRAVGFFSSSALVALTIGICGLVENGGKIQVIASPRLQQEDIDAINDGMKRRNDVIKEALIRELKEPTGRFEQARLNLLSNLIACGKLEIKIAFLEEDNSVGMFHEKLGLMYDAENNIIAFSGSMNESVNAFTTNYEAIDVFSSWTQDNERVLKKHSSFNAMWGDYEPSIRVLEFPEIKDELLKKYRISNDIDTSLDEEWNHNNTRMHEIDEERSIGPYVPSDVEMREYQDKAVDEWARQNYCGIFDMATGTGKTYTALSAAARLFKDKKNNLAVIIICPYQHLVEQWRESIVRFGMKPIVCYSDSPQKNWRDRLRNAVASFNLDVINHFCMVSTNAMFATDSIQDLMRRLRGNVLLIVDEAHNFGADKLSTALLPNAPYRLALSATIDRHGDAEGTRKLYDYFGEKCIEYTLEDAINNHKLTPYYYHPVLVSLDEEELEQYLDLTSKIGKAIHLDKNGKPIITEYVKMLLIKRARIVAGAKSKVFKLKELMQDYVKDNHMLVYCGATTLHDIDYQENKPPVEEARQIDIVADLLGNELGMRISKFTSEEDAEERERLKVDFAEGIHLQALVAIRCLDEGVDIPSIKTAFILASSTNPKEYVQRRGRVLRKAAGKQYAVIYDFITMPIALDSLDEYDEAVIESVKALAVREINRMKDFASIAENPFDSDILIADIKRAYDIDDNIKMEVEEYE